MLRVTQLVGFGGKAENKVLSVQYVDGRAPAAGSATTFTLTTVNFGTAASDRDIFVLASGTRGSSLDTSISSATIGGVSATIGMPTPTGATVNAQAFICWATVTSGTSGTAVVTFANAVSNPSFAIFAVTGRNTTGAAPTDLAYAAALASATTIADTGVDVLAKGSGLFMAYNGTSSRTCSSVTSANLSWSIDADLQYTAGYHCCFGHSSIAPADVSSETVTATYSGSATNRLLAIWAIR